MAFLQSKVHAKKVEVTPFVDKKGNPFKSVVITDEEGNITYVSFSSKMGELTPAEIIAQKDSLRVVKLESGNYSLCKGGFQGEIVDLGL